MRHPHIRAAGERMDVPCIRCGKSVEDGEAHNTTTQYMNLTRSQVIDNMIGEHYVRPTE